MLLIDQEKSGGYTYVETSKFWKTACKPLPCFAELWWPGYLTKVIKTTIDDKDVVIQLWKGWCQRFLGRWANCPGGMGAEVGIYRAVDEHSPKSQRFVLKNEVKLLDRALHKGRANRRRRVEKFAPLKNLVSELPRDSHPDGEPEGEVWYPYPELNTKLWFKLVNPYTNEVLVETSEQTTYWLTRWMTPDSYREEYKKDHETPAFAADYRLHYTINGVTQRVW
ncbi:MAG: hypothetical protein ABI972_17820 [Acidobacteriota bacterium]